MDEPGPAPEWAPPKPAGYQYDLGTSRCRSCGAVIRWAQHEATGRRMPIDPDGTSHFATCPQADRWRRRHA